MDNQNLEPTNMQDNDLDVTNAEQATIENPQTPTTAKPTTNPMTNPATPKKTPKPWVKITISIIVLVVTFIIGMTVGSLIQSNIDSSIPYYLNGGQPEVLKPMLYLYPEQEISVKVKLGNPELLTTTYPKYDNEWQVLAEPNGTLFDKSGREFYGLYWEGAENNATVHEDGFVVAGDDTAKFLEEKLAILGLTEREANEFIVYWLPQLEKNPYNYIRFETKDEIENYMPLEVSPKPDSVIRIIMDYKPLSEPIDVAEQRLTTPARNGFTVVEWGGTEIGEGIIR